MVGRHSSWRRTNQTAQTPWRDAIAAPPFPLDSTSYESCNPTNTTALLVPSSIDASAKGADERTTSKEADYPSALETIPPNLAVLAAWEPVSAPCGLRGITIGLPNQNTEVIFDLSQYDTPAAVEKSGR